MNKLIKMYEKAQSISEWTLRNQPDKDLIYRSGVGSQEQKMLGISYVLAMPPPFVVSYHRSKSVKLPVAAYYKYIEGYKVDVLALVRDNFHDLNCTIMSSHVMNMDMHDIYSTTQREWLEEQKQSALEYMCPKPDRNLPAHNGYEIIADAGDDDWSWYNTNWSGTKVIKHDGSYFLAHCAYLEGISDTGAPYNLYEGPAKDFTFTSGSYAHVAHVINQAIIAARKTAIQNEHIGLGYEEV